MSIHIKVTQPYLFLLQNKKKEHTTLCMFSFCMWSPILYFEVAIQFYLHNFFITVSLFLTTYIHVWPPFPWTKKTPRLDFLCLPSANAFRVSVMLFPISSTATATSVNLRRVFSRITFNVKKELAQTMIITTIYTTTAYVPFLYKKNDLHFLLLL